MQIDIATAKRQVTSVDKQLKDQIKVPTKGEESALVKQALRDSVELLPGILQGKSGIQSPTANALLGELSSKLGPLADLINDSLGQQVGLGGKLGDQDVEIQKRAQELLDGYFNVENTGDRIFDFAFSHFSGGDREAFAAKMKDAIHEGFGQAEKQLGGLADISLETRDYIDNKIEDFINEGKEESGQTGQSIEVEA